MNEKDKAIIQQLKQDSRMPVRDIAKITGLRPSTVHSRIARMQQEGVIERFTLKLDNKAMDESFIAFMLVAADKHIDAKAFDSPHIKEAFGVTGEYDLLLKLKFQDIEQFNSFIIDFRKKYQLKKTHTMISTITLKEDI